MHIDNDVASLISRMVEHRRWLHRHPEIGFELNDTSNYIYEHLKSMDFDKVERVAGTGIKAVMQGTQGNKTFAFRADMDALSLAEETDVDYASSRKGFMHACGHDGHMALLLGFAEWLHMHKKLLRHNVVLIFQPAEESEGGALPMINEGVLSSPEVDLIFAFHIMPDIPEGIVGLSPGAIMAQTCEFDVVLHGKSAHGAMPHRGVDAIIAAAHFINVLQSIITRRINPFEKALVSIGKLEAGERRNILASKVMMEGIIRTFDDATYTIVKENLLNLLDSMGKSHGVTGCFNEVVYYPPVVNHAGLTEEVKAILPKDMVVPVDPMMIAEDFSYYQQKVPGVFMFLGSGERNPAFCHPLHSSSFNFNEDILITGLQIYKNILLSL